MDANTINLLHPTGLGPTCREPALSKSLQAGRGLSVCKACKHSGQEVAHCLEEELKALHFLLELNSLLFRLA